MELNQKLTELYIPCSCGKASLILLWYIALIVIAFGISSVFACGMSILIASLMLTTSLKAFNNIVHECSHNSFSSNRRFNTFIGTVLCPLLLTDYASYKREHFSHHHYLGNYDKDLDFKARSELMHNVTPTANSIAKDIISLRFILHYLPRPMPYTGSALAGVAFYVGGSAIFLATGQAACLMSALVEWIVLFPLLRYVIDLVDHGGLYKDGVAEIYKSRNFVVKNKLLRGILFPRNDCYHLIHHLYPFLPVHQFGKAHDILMRDETYASLPHDADISNLCTQRFKSLPP